MEREHGHIQCGGTILPIKGGPWQDRVEAGQIVACPRCGRAVKLRNPPSYEQIGIYVLVPLHLEL